MPFEIHLSLPAGMHPVLLQELICSAADDVVRLRVAPTSLTLRASGGVEPFMNRLVLARDAASAAARTARRKARARDLPEANRDAALDFWSQCNLRAEHAGALLNALAGSIGALAASPAVKAPIARQGSQTTRQGSHPAIGTPELASAMKGTR